VALAGWDQHQGEGLGVARQRQRVGAGQDLDQLADVAGWVLAVPVVPALAGWDQHQGEGLGVARQRQRVGAGQDLDQLADVAGWVLAVPVAGGDQHQAEGLGAIRQGLDFLQTPHPPTAKTAKRGVSAVLAVRFQGSGSAGRASGWPVPGLRGDSQGLGIYRVASGRPAGIAFCFEPDDMPELFQENQRSLCLLRRAQP